MINMVIQQYIIFKSCFGKSTLIVRLKRTGTELIYCDRQYRHLISLPCCQAGVWIAFVEYVKFILNYLTPSGRYPRRSHLYPLSIRIWKWAFKNGDISIQTCIFANLFISLAYEFPKIPCNGCFYVITYMFTSYVPVSIVWAGRCLVNENKAFYTKYTYT